MNCYRQTKFILFFFIIYYTSTTAQLTATFQGSAVTTDALIGDYSPLNYASSNFGKSSEILSKALGNSTCSYARSLMKFDLSSIPSTATVTSASLSLYFNSTASNPPHSGANSSYLKQITSSWVDTIVTWNTQPSTSNNNMVILPQSTVSTQDYINIDVTALTALMVANPSANYGYELGLVNEICNANLTFCSSKHSVSSKHPKLVVTYNAPTGLSENSANNVMFSIFPNPGKNYFLVTSNASFVLEIFNLNGEKIHSQKIYPGQEIVNLEDQSGGIYFYHFVNDMNRAFQGKLILE